MKILLFDPHVLFREGMASLLRKEPDIHLIDGASNVQEAVTKVRNWKPDLVLMELGANVSDQLEVVRTISSVRPETAIVLLTNHDSDDLLVAALRAGVKGYLSKDSSYEKVLASIRGLQRGEVALSRTMTRRALDLLCNNDNNNETNRKNMETLTSREVEVLELVASGESNRVIANCLSISENTVKIHVHKILKKLNVRNRREAARCARQNGIGLSQYDHSPGLIFNQGFRINR